MVHAHTLAVTQVIKRDGVPVLNLAAKLLQIIALFCQEKSLEKLHLNVMGRDMSVEPGTTFGALAQELQKDFPSPILLAKQGVSARYLPYLKGKAITIQR